MVILYQRIADMSSDFRNFLTNRRHRDIFVYRGRSFMGFAERLKTARVSLGMTQREVADKLGVTVSTYSGYETGKREPDVLKLKLLARILNTSGDVLLETGLGDDRNSRCPTSAEAERILRSLGANELRCATAQLKALYELRSAEKNTEK